MRTAELSAPDWRPSRPLWVMTVFALLLSAIALILVLLTRQQPNGGHAGSGSPLRKQRAASANVQALLPSVLGKPLAQAEMQLKVAGLKVSSVRHSSNPNRPGTVIAVSVLSTDSTDGPAGSILLQVSSG